MEKTTFLILAYLSRNLNLDFLGLGLLDLWVHLHQFLITAKNKQRLEDVRLVASMFIDMGALRIEFTQQRWTILFKNNWVSFACQLSLLLIILSCSLVPTLPKGGLPCCSAL